MRFMDLKSLRGLVLYGSFARRVLLRAFLFALALSMIPLLQSLSGSEFRLFGSHGCIVGLSGSYMLSSPFVRSIWGSFGSMQCEETVNLTANVVRELIGTHMLSHDVKALCVGEGSAAAVLALREQGIENAYGVYRHPFFSFKKQQFVYELDYEDNSFDFVFSRDLQSVSVPAILVLEIERVLKPGGIGALLVSGSGLNANSLVRSATPVSSLLKTSDVVHVGFVNGSNVGDVNDLTLVVFKKRSEVLRYFEQIQLPADCSTLTNNKPFIENMEPLVAKKPIDKKYAYLPNFLDVKDKKRLVYIDIGAGKHLNSSVLNWWLTSYPVNREAFNVYFVDHNTSVMLSYVKKPGITFVYHPGLAGTKDTVNPAESRSDSDSALYVEDEEFDFLAWFKETVQYADFVVMKMNAGNVELKFLTDLFESGAICSVDELFLRCSDTVEGDGAMKGDCMNLFRGLRNSGVFVHQWWSD